MVSVGSVLLNNCHLLYTEEKVIESSIALRAIIIKSYCRYTNLVFTFNHISIIRQITGEPKCEEQWADNGASTFAVRC